MEMIMLHCSGSQYINQKKRSARRKHYAQAVVRRGQKLLPRCRPPSRGCRTAKI